MQISLVSFAVSLIPATETASTIALHQIDRKTGERIRHKKVSENEEAVDQADIIKGYEVRKGEYVTIEPEEIARLRIPSKKTLEIVQFVDIDEIDPEFFEKPYFMVPESGEQTPAFAVVQKALRETGKAALGEVAFAGREHLVAVMPPPGAESRGLMAYTLRYRAELRNADEYFSGLPEAKIDKNQLALAKELIRQNTTKFDATKFVDDYEVALRALIDAKIEHQPLPREAEAPQHAKVINLMDALRKSVESRKPPARQKVAVGKKKPAASGLKLVKPSRKRTA